MNSQQRKEYNKIYMVYSRKKAGFKARKSRLTAQGKCQRCEILLERNPDHDCMKPLMIGWIEITEGHGDWHKYFYYYEKESLNGGTLYHRVHKSQFPELAHFLGSYEDLMKLINTTENL